MVVTRSGRTRTNGEESPSVQNSRRCLTRSRSTANNSQLSPRQPLSRSRKRRTSRNSAETIEARTKRRREDSTLSDVDDEVNNELVGEYRGAVAPSGEAAEVVQEAQDSGEQVAVSDVTGNHENRREAEEPSGGVPSAATAERSDAPAETEITQSVEHPAVGDEGDLNQAEANEVFYYDMAGKERSFSEVLYSFTVPHPESTPPQSLIDVVSLYIVRNEKRRIFPRDTSVAWLSDFFASTWIKKFNGIQGHKSDQDNPFPLTEHIRVSLLPLLRKRFLLFPLLADNCYSLIAFEGIGVLIRLFSTLLEMEKEASEAEKTNTDSTTLAQRVKKLDKYIPLKSFSAISIYHIDWDGSKHEVYRPNLRNYLVHMCFHLVESLRESCSIESLTAFINEHVDLHVRYIPVPPENAVHSAWKVIQYVIIMVQDSEVDPDTGKQTRCQREELLAGKLKDSLCGDARIIREIACSALQNMQSAKLFPKMSPYPGLWGGAVESLKRSSQDHIDLSRKINLTNCLPVVLEFSLKALDDYVMENKERLETSLDSKGQEKNDMPLDLTIATKDGLRLASLRELACTELLPQFQSSVRIMRPWKKAKERQERFWKSIFDHVTTLPPYQDAGNVFDAMRRFPDSVSACLGLEYLHSKEHRLFFLQASTPNFRQGERPWKLFDHGSKNLSRASQWFQRNAWGRMHEAGVILFAITEAIMRCAVSRDVKTERDLVSALKATRLEAEEHLSSTIICPVNLRDIVHHQRKSKESLEKYRQRVIKRIQDAAEATKITLSCASDAFKSALCPFGLAYGVKRGAEGLNVPLCKLRSIPDNMLDILWKNVTKLLKETLVSREKKGDFSFEEDELSFDLESQLIRLFRLMNAIFSQSSDTTLKDDFQASLESLKQDVARFERKEGFGKRLIKLQSIPAFASWNFVDSRYSSGYISSAQKATPSVIQRDIAAVVSELSQTAAEDADITPLQALSMQGITPLATSSVFDEGSTSLAPVLDISLAMQTDPLLYVDPKKANFGWGLVTALGCILQKIPSHVRRYSCRRNQLMSCAPNVQVGKAVSKLATEIGGHVFNIWATQYGIYSLECQSVFTRFDALMSSALQIASLPDFQCRPSIDASLCHQRHLRRNFEDEREAFLGFPAYISIDNGPFIDTKWRGGLSLARFQKLPYPIQRLQVDMSSTGTAGGVKIDAVDFLNLSAFEFKQPEVYRITLRYLPQTPECSGCFIRDESGEVCFQLGDVFWFSMIITDSMSRDSFAEGRGYSGTHLGVMMEDAENVRVESQANNDGWTRRGGCVMKEQDAAILFMPQDGNKDEAEGLKPLFERMENSLEHTVRGRGTKMIQMVPTGVNIENELITYHITFRRSDYIPRATNLGTIHPKLLQMHTQFVLTALHRSSTVSSRRKGLFSGQSLQQKHVKMFHEMCKVLEEIYPRLKPEQLKAIALPLLWTRVMEQAFFGDNGSPLPQVARLFPGSFTNEELSFIGSNMFFIRGPPGTGKSAVITSLIDAALFGHSSEEDTQKALPARMNRILVITHTNTTVDDILVKVSRTRNYELGKLVRVGVRGKDQRALRYNVKSVLEKKMEKKGRENRKRGSRPHALHYSTEHDIVSQAAVVFSTFGSLKRSEFFGSLKSFDMIIIEEAAKIHDGDLLTGLALSTGMKDPPRNGTPLPMVLVGDELQLPPHSNVNPNLGVPRLCPAPLFHRYVTKCEKIAGEFDFNFPVTLVTQHRAHRAIANVHSNFAYNGIIQTGARETLQKWLADEMDHKIHESEFKFRTVSMVSYQGSLHGDTRGPPSMGGNINAFESELIVNICERWFYWSPKFANRITVLSPYKAQVERIKRELKTMAANTRFKQLADVGVYTVDSSQGIESDIVILSLVRTHHSQNQAFLDNPHRINVMVSRAKERLIVIGAREEISSVSPNWQRFYAIVDALAREEIEANAKGVTEEGHEVTPEPLNYGFYKAIKSSDMGVHITEVQDKYVS